MAIAEPVLRRVRAEGGGGDLLARCEDEVVRLSLANLMSFPWIAEAVAEGRLSLQGFRFGIQSGVLARLEGERFVPVPV
jgi:carbonic anhydrase